MKFKINYFIKMTIINLRKKEYFDNEDHYLLARLNGDKQSHLERRKNYNSPIKIERRH